MTSGDDRRPPSPRRGPRGRVTGVARHPGAPRDTHRRPPRPERSHPAAWLWQGIPGRGRRVALRARSDRPRRPSVTKSNGARSAERASPSSNRMRRSTSAASHRGGRPRRRRAVVTGVAWRRRRAAATGVARRQRRRRAAATNVARRQRRLGLRRPASRGVSIGVRPRRPTLPVVGIPARRASRFLRTVWGTVPRNAEVRTGDGSVMIGGRGPDRPQIQPRSSNRDRAGRKWRAASPRADHCSGRGRSGPDPAITRPGPGAGPRRRRPDRARP